MSITSTTFESVAELTQAPTPAAPSHSRVLGYYAAGDGGGGDFWWDAKDRADDDRALTLRPSALAASRPGRWRRLLDGDCNVLWFGARGDGVADDTDALQAAIDAVLRSVHRPGPANASAGPATVFLPPGIYKIQRPLHLGWGRGFDTASLAGAGRSYAGVASAFVGTVIDATSFSNAPAIAVQGMRNAVVRDLTIIGANHDHLGAKSQLLYDLDQPDAAQLKPKFDELVAANWVDPRLDPDADGRYSPYAAIAIDPYSGPRPTPSYPDVAHPAWTGITNQYEKNFSSNVLLARVEIRGFVAGLAIQPCDADGNGDFVTLEKCTITSCKYGFTVGNSQSRNVAIRDCTMAALHTAFTNARHGRQRGRFGGTLSNLSAGQIVQLFDINATAFAGATHVDNLYVESLYRLGKIGTFSSGETPWIFTSCAFAMSAQSERRGVPARWLEGGFAPRSNAPIVFRGCHFHLHQWVVAFQHDHAQFEDCVFTPRKTYAEAAPDQASRLAHNALCGGLVVPAFGLDRRLAFRRLRFSPYDLDQGARSGSATVGPSHAGSRAFTIPAYAEEVHSRDVASARQPVPRRLVVFAKQSLAPTLVGRTLTLTFRGRSEGAFHLEGPLPGDVLWDDVLGSVFYVKTREGQTVTAELVNNYRIDDNGKAHTLEPLDLAQGHFYGLNSRLYATAQPALCGATEGGRTLTDVQRDDGFAGALSEIREGDWLYADPYLDRLTSSDDGSRITGVDPTQRTLTLSGPARRTQNARRLPLLVRWPG